MKQQLQEMLELQNNLNTFTSGDDWKSWITNKGKTINWKRCIYMEMAEAIDSVNWKHWKNIEGNIDFENFKIEMIDIWHFLMSELLRLYDIPEIIDIVEENMDYEAEIKIPKIWKKEHNKELDDMLIPFEALMGMSLLPIESDKEFIENYVQEFFVCLDAASIDFPELYKLYIWKNVLNKFRQNNGYKEGNYTKIWNGEEDNVHMQKVVETTTGFDNIYNELEKIYNEKCM